MTDEMLLLHEYVTTASPEAFAKIVRQYVDLVYAAARRQVKDAALAEDVTQAAFMVLAKKAASVPTDRPLSGWLLKTTTYCAANARRSELHRQQHERRAAQMARDDRNDRDDGSGGTFEELSPLLDEGLNKLKAADRDALLLKFFEKKSLRQVGESMGISEEAAGKRVSRAVDRLRDFFKRRGVAVSAAALSAALLSESTKAAPIALARMIAASGAAGAAAAAASTSASAAAISKGAMVLVATEKAKAVAVLAAVLILGVGGGVVAVKSALPSSSTPRQVRIDAQPVVATAPAPPQPASKWKFNFAGGASIEILGVNDVAQTPGNWWLPDGSPAPDPIADSRRGSSIRIADPGSRVLMLVARVQGAGDRGTHLEFQDSTASGSQLTNRSDGTEVTWIGKLPADADVAKLRLGVAAVNWDSELVLVPGKSTEGTAGDMTVNGVREQNGKTIVDAVLSPQPGETLDRRVTVTVNGKELLPSSIESTSNLLQSLSHQIPVTYTFNCRLNQVTQIRCVSRPFEMIELDNVSLLRGKQTNVGGFPVAAGPTFPVQFSDGTIVETLAINDPEATPQKWWSANGAPTSPPDLRGLDGAGVSRMPGQVRRRIALRMTGPVRDHSLAVRLAPPLASATGTTSDGKELFMNVVAALPEGQTTTAMRIGVSRGPWREDDRLTPSGSSSTQPARQRGRIVSITESNARTVARILPPPKPTGDERDERIFAKLKDGRELTAGQIGFDAENFGDYTFNCPIAQVDRIVIQSRPFEWAQMRNVALAPATTSPTSIEVVRPTVAQTSP